MSITTDRQENHVDVIADYTDELEQIRMEGNELAVRKARNALFWAGGLIFFWEMIDMFREPTGFDATIFIVALIEGGIFAGLAFWTKTKPYTAVITGLIVFIAIILLSIVINGMLEGSAGVAKALFSGIIVKVLILINLIRPLKDAKELQEWLNRKKI